jgi:addiction module HigA family antidote
MNPTITPGEILLEEYLQLMGISQNAMARAVGVSPRAINEIVHGKRAITPAMSIRFGAFFGQYPNSGTASKSNAIFAPSRKTAKNSPPTSARRQSCPMP